MQMGQSVVCIAVLMAAGSVLAQDAPRPQAPQWVREALAPVEDKAGLPRVLLIGDSISMGYTVPVRELLAEKANVHRPPMNCMSTDFGIEMLDAWLGESHWDVIHFNWGLHDLKYVDEAGAVVAVDKGKPLIPVEEYERNLDQLVQRLKKTNAKLIFATTTPVPDGSAGRVPGDEIRYNQAALRVMKKHGVAVNDLHTLAADKLSEIQLPHNVHFTPEGSRVLAKRVAEVIEKFLPPATERQHGS